MMHFEVESMRFHINVIIWYGAYMVMLLGGAGVECEDDSSMYLFQDDTIEPLLEPRHRVILGDTVLEANASLALFSPRHTHSWSPQDHVEIHTKDTDTRVISGTEIDVLLDTETKVARVREVLPSQLILLHLETTLKNLLSLGPSDGNVNSNFLVSSDTECTDGVAGFGGNGCLAGKLFQDFGCTGQAITRFADTDVDDELLDFELLHGVGGCRLLLGHVGRRLGVILSLSRGFIKRTQVSLAICGAICAFLHGFILASILFAVAEVFKLCLIWLIH